MSNQDNMMTAWRYFRWSRTGNEGMRIYRCPDNGKKVEEQRLEDVHRLLEDGTWRPNQRMFLLDEMLKGWFDEEDDEISEQEAMNYYRS